MMTPERFRECLQQIGWTMRGVAQLIGQNEIQIRRWAAGLYPVPNDVARWLEKLAAAHEKNPPPNAA